MNEKIRKMAEERIEGHRLAQEKVQKVRERFPDVRWPNVYSRPAAYVDGASTVHIEDRVAVLGDTVVDEFNKETQSFETVPHTAFYSFASKQYKIVPHEEALTQMENILTELPEYGTPTVKPVIYKEGARLKISVKFPDVKFEVGPHKESINPAVELRNSYDLSSEFQVKFGAHQMVCSNGLYAFKTMQKLSKKHRKNLNTEAVVQEITDYMGKFSEQIGLWDKWAHKKLADTGVQEIMDEIGFSEKRAAEIVQLPLMGRGQENLKSIKTPTYWDLNSAITQFLTHQVESEMVRTELSERVPSIIQGHFRRAA